MAGIKDGKGKLLKNTVPLFTELAKEYPCDKYTAFCNELGFSYNQAKKILKRGEHQGDSEGALKDVLNNWVDKAQNVTRAKLESALENAETGGLIDIVKRHFAKATKEEESSEETGATNNQSGCTQTINAFGRANVTGSTVTGSVTNMNIYNHETGASTSQGQGRKRKDAGSKTGSSSGKKKAKRGNKK